MTWPCSSLGSRVTVSVVGDLELEAFIDLYIDGFNDVAVTDLVTSELPPKAAAELPDNPENHIDVPARDDPVCGYMTANTSYVRCNQTGSSSKETSGTQERGLIVDRIRSCGLKPSCELSVRIYSDVQQRQLRFNIDRVGQSGRL